MNGKIPDVVVEILKTLNDAGFDAYVVGGAVRDYFMGLEPHDWDVATSAKPEQVKELFDKTIDTGIKHGTVTAMIDGEGYEITTFRSDGEYSDGRHPDEVGFVESVEEDLSRRDFTINAMAMDANGNMVDPFGGLEDIEKGVIRCVGNPDDRFSEDALRMLRAIRFEAKLGFALDDGVKASIARNADGLYGVSSERIRDELTKTLVSPSPKRGFLDAYETGITKRVLPEFDRMMECGQDTPYHYASVGIHTLDSVERIRPEPNLRWTMLFHDMGKPAVKERVDDRDVFHGHPAKSREVADEVMTRLRFSNDDRREIGDLVERHDTTMSRDSRIREFAAKYGEDFLDKLCEVKIADVMAHRPEHVDGLMRRHMGFVDKAKGFVHDGTAIRPRDLEINGFELQEYGFQGKAIGDFLRSAYRDCLGNPSLNSNEKLRARALSTAKREGLEVKASVSAVERREFERAESVETSKEDVDEDSSEKEDFERKEPDDDVVGNDDWNSVVEDEDEDEWDVVESDDVDESESVVADCDYERDGVD